MRLQPRIDPQMVEMTSHVLRQPIGLHLTLNSFRLGELQGARDLATMVELTDDMHLRMQWTRHAMDEGKHAYLFAKRLVELGGEPGPMPPEMDFLEMLRTRANGYDVHAKKVAGEKLDDADVIRFFAAAKIVEENAHASLVMYHEALGADFGTRKVIETVAIDEEYHISYVNAEIEKLRSRFPKEMNEMIALYHDLYPGVYADFNEALLARLEPIALGEG